MNLIFTRNLTVTRFMFRVQVWQACSDIWLVKKKPTKCPVVNLNCLIHPTSSKRWANHSTKHHCTVNLSSAAVRLWTDTNAIMSVCGLRAAANCAPSVGPRRCLRVSLSETGAYKTAGPIQYTVPASITGSTLPAGRVAGIGTSIILTLESEKYKASLQYLIMNS